MVNLDLRTITYLPIIVKNVRASSMVCTSGLCTYRVRIRNKCSVKLETGPWAHKQCHLSVLLSFVSRLGVWFWWTFTLCLFIFSRVSYNIIIVVYNTCGKWHDRGDCSVTFVEGLQNRSRTSRIASSQHRVYSHVLEILGRARTFNEIPCLGTIISYKNAVVFWGPVVLSFPLEFYLIQNPLCSWW